MTAVRRAARPSVRPPKSGQISAISAERRAVLRCSVTKGKSGPEAHRFHPPTSAVVTPDQPDPPRLQAPPVPAGPRRARAVAWLAVYAGLGLLPLGVLLADGATPGGGFVWDFALALGFAGLAVLALQPAVSARFRCLSETFGADPIARLHRLAAFGACVLVAAHWAILRIRYPETLGPLDPRAAPWHLTAGRLAFASLATLMLLSLWRRPRHRSYEQWRTGHAALAVGALGLAVAHALGATPDGRSPWLDGIWTAGAATGLVAVGYLRLLRPLRLYRTPYRVAEVHREHGKAWSLTLLPEGHPGLAFRAGQFAWVTLRAGPWAGREHPFSFAGSAAAAPVLRFTVKELGDFTRTIGAVRAGETAYVDGPHGAFSPDHVPGATALVFVAGGIGVAPMMSMLRTAADRGERRPLRLVYGNRCWDNVIFRDELEALRSRLRLEIVYVLEEPPEFWAGLTGVLDQCVLRQAVPPTARAADFFICGPEAMVEAAEPALRALGVPRLRLHSERFELS